jgi:hypothetical protein
MPAILPSINLDSVPSLRKRFMTHQVNWIIAEDEIHKQGKQVFALAEKSVRVGWSHCDAYKNVRKRLHFKARDYLFATKDYPSAIEYIRVAKSAAEVWDYARSIVSHGEEHIKVPRLKHGATVIPVRSTEQKFKFRSGRRCSVAQRIKSVERSTARLAGVTANQSIHKKFSHRVYTDSIDAVAGIQHQPRRLVREDMHEKGQSRRPDVPYGCLGLQPLRGSAFVVSGVIKPLTQFLPLIFRLLRPTQPSNQHDRANQRASNSTNPDGSFCFQSGYQRSTINYPLVRPNPLPLHTAMMPSLRKMKTPFPPKPTAYPSLFFTPNFLP